MQEVTHQLRHMCSLILSATPGSNDSSCTLVDLTSVGEIPIMPTLSGWLLQYPVVYLAHPDTAVIMAQLLSEAVLVLYDVQVAGLFHEVGLQHNHWQSCESVNSTCTRTHEYAIT